MAKYRVEVFYKTKRGGVCLGMEVDAFDPDEAEQIACDKALKGYPARQFCGCKITEAVANPKCGRITLPLQSPKVCA